MSKIFPIKVESTDKKNYKIVEWMIGNTCNYNCSFCPDLFKSGSQKFLNIDIYKKTIDKLLTECNGSKIWFKITGGEPTLYSNFFDLLTYIKETKNYTYAMSNGSRTLRYWEELNRLNVLDIIAFTYHPEQTSDIEHMINVINLFTDSPTLTLVNITFLPKYTSDVINAYNLFKSKCKTIINILNISDEDGIEKYNTEQKEIFKKLPFCYSNNFKLKKLPNIPNEDSYHNGIITYKYNDNTIKIDHASNFIKRYEDNFYGYTCNAGINLIRMNGEEIQRGICGVGEKWSIYDEKLFRDSPIKCTKTSCQCMVDIIQPKYFV